VWIFFHARQHLWDVARKLYPGQEAEQKRWMATHQDELLDEGKIEALVTSLRAIDSVHPELLEKIRAEADHFDNNKEHTRYPNCRAAATSTAASKTTGRAGRQPDRFAKD
jgi:hypothetical protein